MTDQFCLAAGGVKGDPSQELVCHTDTAVFIAGLRVLRVEIDGVGQNPKEKRTGEVLKLQPEKKWRVRVRLSLK